MGVSQVTDQVVIPQGGSELVVWLFEVDGVVLRVLPLERIIASKRATGRPKDLAAMPALEAALAAKNGRDSSGH